MAQPKQKINWLDTVDKMEKWMAEIEDNTSEQNKENKDVIVCDFVKIGAEMAFKNLQFLKQVLLCGSKGRNFPIWGWPDGNKPYFMCGGQFICSASAKEKIQELMCISGSVYDQQMLDLFSICNIQETSEKLILVQARKISHVGEAFEQIQKWKGIGNKIFKNGDYEGAILIYKAILIYGKKRLNCKIKSHLNVQAKVANNISICLEGLGRIPQAIIFNEIALKFIPQYQKCLARRQRLKTV